MAIKILLVDDHHLMRQGLKALLQGQKDFVVVGEASDGRAAVRLIRELAPDVAVMDLRMPDLNGIDATRQAIAVQPNLKVIGLSGQSDEQMAREMLRAGASGYILKDSAFEELVMAIQAVMEDRVYLSPAVSRMIVRAYRQGDVASVPTAFTSLSPRERQIVQLFSEGKSTKEIAAMLELSTKTVETHRRNVMAKTQANGIAELTRYAIREGITSL